MPWTVETRDGIFAVVREGGKVVGRHKTRRQALQHQRALYAIESKAKSSDQYAEALKKAYERRFSSRSEAGRHAAQVRWGSRGGNATTTQPSMAGLDSTQQALVTRLNEATDAMAASGVAVSVMPNKVPSRTVRGLSDAWEDSCLHLPKGHGAVRSNNEAMGIRILINAHGAETRRSNSWLNNTTLVVAHNSDKKVVAGLAQVGVMRSGRLPISYMASSQIVKGAGSAMLAAVIKHAVAKGAKEISLEAVAGAVPFWEKMGFLGYKQLSGGGKMMVLGKLDQLAGALK